MKKASNSHLGSWEGALIGGYGAVVVERAGRFSTGFPNYAGEPDARCRTQHAVDCFGASVLVAGSEFVRTVRKEITRRRIPAHPRKDAQY